MDELIILHKLVIKNLNLLIEVIEKVKALEEKVTLLEQRFNENQNS